MSNELKKVEVYTDGACSGNPGPGGWAAVLLFGKDTREISGYVEYTTNQRMELQAAIEGLKVLKYPCKVNLYSDSAYLINAFNKKWLWKWKNNGWLNSKKEPVENQDQWELLIELTQKHQVEWIKVEGHADNSLNNLCDHLAREAIKEKKGVDQCYNQDQKGK